MKRQMVNAAAGKSEKKPVANLGQGFLYDPTLQKFKLNVKLTSAVSGYNPPDFVLEAAKQSFNTVECNQYAPPPVCLRGHLAQ
jgi:kynurenine aminotransferase